jgi:FMN phosphatase YigB (HAD superfamily)
MAADQDFIIGVDLDGVVADFYGCIREVAAEWLGVDLSELTSEVSWGMPEWGLRTGEYEALHRFAVTQRSLFSAVAPIPGAPQSLRRLSDEKARIRIITHRLLIPYFHRTAVQQTVEWLDHHGMPYWDLCFMKDKGEVGAHIYLEDSPGNIAKLRALGKKVVVFTNSTNRGLPDGDGRADTWYEAETMIRSVYYSWRTERNLPLPPQPGVAPPPGDPSLAR